MKVHDNRLSLQVMPFQQISKPTFIDRTVLSPLFSQVAETTPVRTAPLFAPTSKKSDLRLLPCSLPSTPFVAPRLAIENAKYLGLASQAVHLASPCDLTDERHTNSGRTPPPFLDPSGDEVVSQSNGFRFPRTCDRTGTRSTSRSDFARPLCRVEWHRDWHCRKRRMRARWSTHNLSGNHDKRVVG